MRAGLNSNSPSTDRLNEGCGLMCPSRAVSKSNIVTPGSSDLQGRTAIMQVHTHRVATKNPFRHLYCLVCKMIALQLPAVHVPRISNHGFTRRSSVVRIPCRYTSLPERMGEQNPPPTSTPNQGEAMQRAQARCLKTEHV